MSDTNQETAMHTNFSITRLLNEISNEFNKTLISIASTLSSAQQRIQKYIQINYKPSELLKVHNESLDQDSTNRIEAINEMSLIQKTWKLRLKRIIQKVDSKCDYGNQNDIQIFLKEGDEFTNDQVETITQEAKEIIQKDGSKKNEKQKIDKPLQKSELLREQNCKILGVEYEDIRVRCNQCSKTIKNTGYPVVEHLAEAHKMHIEKNLFCPLCPLDFTQPRSLSLHLFKEHGHFDKKASQFRFTCPFLKQEFIYQDQLFVFVLKHFNFYSYFNLEQIQKIREQAGDYQQLDVYSYSFTRNKLNRIVCPKCSDQHFSDLHQMANHLKRVHNIMPKKDNHFKCPHCFVEASKKYQLVEHLIEKHGEIGHEDRYPTYKVVGSQHQISKSRVSGQLRYNKHYYTYYDPKRDKVKTNRPRELDADIFQMRKPRKMESDQRQEDQDVIMLSDEPDEEESFV